MTRTVVTAQRLIAMARERGAIVLPGNALITPAAADWLLTAKVPVTQEGAAPPVPAEPTFHLLGDGGDPYVRALLPGLERRFPSLEFLSCRNDRRCLLEHLRTITAALSEDPARRAVVVANGAVVSCVANKQARVRAAILDQPGSLRMLMRELGANLLILEPGRFSPGQARASCEQFFTGRTSTCPSLASALPPFGEPAGPGGEG